MSRVTFVNGHWQGLQIPEETDLGLLYNSCPMVWEYLESAGRDGWELVTAAAQQGAGAGDAASLLFLKRESGG